MSHRPGPERSLLRAAAPVPTSQLTLTPGPAPKRALQWREGKGREWPGTYLQPGREPQLPTCTPGRSQAGRGRLPREADSLTPRFRAAAGQPEHGVPGRPANGVAPLSANQPMARRPRGKFERQLLAPRSAQNNEAPNSNQRSRTRRRRARGGRSLPGVSGAWGVGRARGVWWPGKKKDRRSSSGSSRSAASLGLRHGERQRRRDGGGGRGGQSERGERDHGR